MWGSNPFNFLVIRPSNKVTRWLRLWWTSYMRGITVCTFTSQLERYLSSVQRHLTMLTIKLLSGIHHLRSHCLVAVLIVLHSLSYWTSLAAFAGTSMWTQCVHVNADMQLHFLRVLKRLALASADMLVYYRSVIRPVIEYMLFWQSSITIEQHCLLDFFQTRAIRIIFGSNDYQLLCVQNNVETVSAR
jgi:hypothetical protein